MSDDDDATLTQHVMRRVHRVVRWVAKKAEMHGRTVKHQMLRGVSYGVGSGAVSLLVVWYENRH